MQLQSAIAAFCLNEAVRFDYRSEGNTAWLERKTSGETSDRSDGAVRSREIDIAGHSIGIQNKRREWPGLR